MTSRTQELIASTSLTFATRSYDAGDLFVANKLDPSVQRLVDTMVASHARKLLPLNASNMALALERRPAGLGVPKGFTLAGLLGQDLITEDQAKKYGWSDDDASADAADADGDETPPADAVKKVGSVWVVKAKTNGGPPRFDVVNGKGERVLSGGTIAGQAKAIAKAQEYVDSIPPKEEKDDDAITTSSVLPEIVGVGGYKVVSLDIAVAAHELSELNIADWNALTEDVREAKIQDMVTYLDANPDKVPELIHEDGIVSRPEPVDDEAERLAQLDALLSTAGADVEAMDLATLKVWLADQDMHGADGASEEDLRAAAVKVRDAAKEAVARLEAETQPEGSNEGKNDGGDVQQQPGDPA